MRKIVGQKKNALPDDRILPRKFTLAYLQPLSTDITGANYIKNPFACKMIMCRPENSKAPFPVASPTVNTSSSNFFIPSIVYWKQKPF